MSFLSSVFGINAMEFEFGGNDQTSAKVAAKRQLDPIQGFYPITIRRQLWIICTFPHPLL